MTGLSDQSDNYRVPSDLVWLTSEKMMQLLLLLIISRPIMAVSFSFVYWVVW